jgi:hypothetical protein
VLFSLQDWEDMCVEEARFNEEAFFNEEARFACEPESDVSRSA